MWATASTPRVASSTESKSVKVRDDGIGEVGHGHAVVTAHLVAILEAAGNS